MADLLGFEARGIEIAPDLVREARGLAERYESNARFAQGSYIPEGYRWVSDSGDERMGTVGIGESAYPALGEELSDFDWVFAYPWPGEAELLRDLVERCGAPRTKLLLHGWDGGVAVQRPPGSSPTPNRTQ